MREVLPQLLGWWRSGDEVALATVVGTWQSAPRQPGATMLVGPDKSVVGSLSGGCVEADVYAVAEEVLADGRPRLKTYGVSDSDVFTVGLTCGGIIDVFVQRVSPATFPELEQVAEAVAKQRPVALATVVRHPDPARVGQRLILEEERVAGTLGSQRIDAAVAADAAGLLAAGCSNLLTYGPDGQRRGEGMQVFVECFAPQARLLVFGATDFAAAVVALGSFTGYRVTVCDARPLFATRTRFPNADEVVVQRPHRYLEAELQAGRIDSRTAICVLTHDPKFDVPLLKLALTMPLTCYVGAMGSRRTHEDRLAKLVAEGLGSAALRRLSSPIGLDLGARTPEETAISILGEIIAYRWGGTGTQLSQAGTPIHHEASAQIPNVHADPHPAVIE
jgi:xanthine dehydrogenase accessory factor